MKPSGVCMRKRCEREREREVGGEKRQFQMKGKH